MQMSPHTLALIIEVRRRLILSVLCSMMVFAGFCIWREPWVNCLVMPLAKQLGTGQIIATHVLHPLWIPLQCAFYGTLGVLMPFYIYQGWAFIAPALYPEEKRSWWCRVFFSVVLFYLGVALTYFMLLPWLCWMTVWMTPSMVTFMPDLAAYVSFALYLMMLLGVAFELPTAMWVLYRLEWVSIAGLKSKRRYVIVLAFTLGMLLTPPDVVSQITLAIPLCLLYEVGLIMIAWDDRQLSKLYKTPSRTSHL